MNKQRWFLRLVIAALYLSAFEALLRGMVRSVAPGLEIFVVVIFEFIIFGVPVLFAWYGSLDRRFYFLLGVIFFLVVLYPFRIQGDLLSYLLEFKFYFVCLFYIPIIKYLSKFPGFEEAFLKHFFYILTAYALWEAVELLSAYVAPNIELMMKRFMFNFDTMEAEMTAPGHPIGGFGRPIGLGLDYQTGALAIAIYCVICLLQERYVLYSLGLILGYMTFMRTWFVAALTASILIMIRRMSLRNLGWILFILLFLAGLYFKMTEHFNDYIRQFGEGGSGGIILDLFLNDGWFLFVNGGFFPNGFVRLGYSPIFGSALAELPPQFLINEVAMLRMHYEMGGIATLMWFMIMYHPLLKRGITFFRNDYLIILFMSLIGFTHHLTIFKPFMFIFFIFCSIQSYRKQKLPNMFDAVG